MQKSPARADFSGWSAGRAGRRRRLKGKRGRGTLTKEEPPIFGMPQRTGAVVIRMLEKRFSRGRSAP